MSRQAKILEQILRAGGEANVRFDDACFLLARLGFSQRQGPTSHLKFQRGGDFVNIQNRGGKIPPYQVRQIRVILSKQP